MTVWERSIAIQVPSLDDRRQVAVEIEPGAVSLATLGERSILFPEVGRQLVVVESEMSALLRRDDNATVAAERVAELHRAVLPQRGQVDDDQGGAMQSLEDLDVHEGCAGRLATH